MVDKKFHQGTENLKKVVPGAGGGNPKVAAKLVAFSKTPGSRNRTMYRTEELRPWMKVYAAWIALHENLHLPGLRDRVNKVRGMCRGKLTMRGLKYLEDRQDFKNLVEELKRDELKRARMIAEIHAADMVDWHHEATGKLMEEKRYDKIAPLTTPYLDRVWPKVEEQKQQGQAIIVNIGGDSYAKHQLATLDDEDPPTVEASEVFEEEAGDDVSPV